jgi:hypothetical protein
VSGAAVAFAFHLQAPTLVRSKCRRKNRKKRSKKKSISLSLKREQKPILECKFTKYCFLFNLHNHKTNPNFCKRNCHHEFLFVARNKLKIGNTTRTLCQQLYPRMISWLLFSKWYKELIPKPLAWFQH